MIPCWSQKKNQRRPTFLAFLSVTRTASRNSVGRTLALGAGESEITMIPHSVIVISPFSVHSLSLDRFGLIC